MNPLCKVCGDLAAGFHFGVFTCDGCKSFFGRAYNKSQMIPECKKKSNCAINKNTRTTCKACRLTKCIQVGMSKGGSKFGRRSNWFKIKFLLEEQQKDQNNKSQNESIDALAQAALHASAFQSAGHSIDKATTDSQMPSRPFKFDQTHELANPFYSAAMQCTLNSTFLHKAIEGFSNFYLNQQKQLQQQRHHSNDVSLNSEISEDNDDRIDPPAKRRTNADRRMLSSPTSSTISSSASSSSLLNLPATDKQDYPMDLSLKSRSPVDFSISGLLKINAP